MRRNIARSIKSDIETARNNNMGYINEATFVEYIKHINDKLFTAIIYNNADEITRLKASGRKLSETVEKAITESVSDDIWFEYCYISSNLSDGDFMRVMSELALAVGEDKKLHFTDWFFHINEKRFFDPKLLGFILDHFNQSKINKTRLMKAFIDRDNVPCLKLVVGRGWIKQPKKRDEMIQYAVENGKTECTSWLMDFKNRTADFTAEREKEEKKMMRELNADPNSVTELKKLWSFKKQDDDTLMITNYKGASTEITIPDKIGKSVVTAIGEHALSPTGQRKTKPEVLRNITKITLPDTIKFIGKSAFRGCENLTEINIPDSVEEIRDSAFFNCKSLKSLTLPDSVKKIESSAFTGCEKLVKIKLPNGITEIASNIFSACRSLETIEIPDSVKKIDLFPFKFCDNLKTVIIPPSVLTIENHTDFTGKIWTIFHGSQNVTAIVEPDSCAEGYCKKYNIPYKNQED